MGHQLRLLTRSRDYSWSKRSWSAKGKPVRGCATTSFGSMEPHSNSGGGGATTGGGGGSLPRRSGSGRSARSSQASDGCFGTRRKMVVLVLCFVLMRAVVYVALNKDQGGRFAVAFEAVVCGGMWMSICAVCGEPGIGDEKAVLDQLVDPLHSCL